jgi:MFS family permease
VGGTLADARGSVWASRYKWHAVAMLWWIALFNYADRQAIFSVFPLLKEQFHLSQEHLGLLGSSFAWVYGLTAPFAGNIVDRIRRKTAILGGLQAWSAICMATSLSRGFPALLFFRAAEGLGETFYFPASMSLLSDYHGPDTRSRALGLHQTSVYAGTVAGGYFAGLIGQNYGWRWSFIVFGGLGILLGFVLSRRLIEPKRVTTTEGRVRLHDFLAEIRHKPAALLILGGFLCANYVALVLLSWMPSFLFERFHLSLATSGLTATIFVQFASMAGAPLGGWLADFWSRRTPAGRTLVQALGLALGAPFVALCGWTRSIPLLILALTFWGLAKGIYDSNIFAAMFDVIRPEARGTAAGFLNLVGWMGGGVAPLATGFLASWMGLGPAISFAAVIYVVGAVCLGVASFRLRR